MALLIELRARSRPWPMERPGAAGCCSPSHCAILDLSARHLRREGAQSGSRRSRISGLRRALRRCEMDVPFRHPLLLSRVERRSARAFFAKGEGQPACRPDVTLIRDGVSLDPERCCIRDHPLFAFRARSDQEDRRARWHAREFRPARAPRPAHTSNHVFRPLGLADCFIEDRST